MCKLHLEIIANNYPLISQYSARRLENWGLFCGRFSELVREQIRYELMKISFFQEVSCKGDHLKTTVLFVLSLSIKLLLF